MRAWYLWHGDQQPADNRPNNWSEFLNTNMMRCNPHERMLRLNNVGNLELKWISATGASSPAAVNGVV